MKKRNFIIIIAFLALIAALFYACDQVDISRKEGIEIVTTEFEKYDDDFKEIAALMLTYTNKEVQITTSEYAPNDSEVSEIIYQNEAGQRISNLGYDMIRKTLDGGVYFFRFRMPKSGRGLMYYPNGFQPEYNGLITEYIPLTEDGWYYFAQK